MTDNIVPPLPTPQKTNKPFSVWIYPQRGIQPSWREFAQCESELAAKDLVDYHKEIDKKFPVGYYSYQIVRNLPPDTIVTCVYCGHQYPPNSPTSGAEVLTDHIKVCEKHPMRKLEEDKKKLKQVLALHHCMVLSGEQPTEASEEEFNAAMRL